MAITDEQAPLPDALSQLLTRIRRGLSSPDTGDLVFNCQMGRGRTTTGMVTACLISTTLNWNEDSDSFVFESEMDGKKEEDEDEYDPIDGPSEEDAYLQGEFHDVVGPIVDLISRFLRLRRIQDYSSARRGSYTRESSKTVDRQSY